MRISWRSESGRNPIRGSLVHRETAKPARAATAPLARRATETPARAATTTATHPAMARALEATIGVRTIAPRAMIAGPATAMPVRRETTGTARDLETLRVAMEKFATV